MAKLTAARLRELLNYDPKTGIFTYASYRKKCRIGDVAGVNRQDGYLVIGIDYKTYRGTHLAYLWMTGRWPSNEIDHINNDPTDNRWSNLRPATHTQQRYNSRVRRTKLTPKGASWHKNRNGYQSHITVNGRMIYLGFFRTAEEAHAVYLQAAKQYFGKFARAK